MPHTNVRILASQVPPHAPYTISRRHGQLIDGAIVFSPHSRRKVQFPPASPPSRVERYPWAADIKEFHQPQWWSQDFGYLAFLPLVPSFSSILFKQTFSIPHLPERLDGKYHLPTHVVLSLARVEHQLLTMIADLLNI